MSYDQGIDFRSISTYVTDPMNCTYETGYSIDYPRTTPQGNTVGWESVSSLNVRDRSISIDPRLAGIAFENDAFSSTYRFDLPTPGKYEITLAAGDDSILSTPYVVLVDTDTVLATLCNGTVPAGSFYDSMGSIWTAAAWPGSNQKYVATFATTICRFVLNPSGDSGPDFPIAHARVTAVGQSSLPVNSGGHVLMSGGHPVVSGGLALLAGIIERRQRLMGGPGRGKSQHAKRPQMGSA